VANITFCSSFNQPDKMVYQCCVRGCPTKVDKSIPRTLHRFPSNPPALTNIWKAKAGLSEEDSVENKRICSLHFNLEDFNTATKRIHLKNNAIPTNIDLGIKTLVFETRQIIVKSINEIITSLEQVVYEVEMKSLATDDVHYATVRVSPQILLQIK